MLKKCRIILFFAGMFVLSHAQDIVPLPNKYDKTGELSVLPKTLTVSSSDEAFKELIPGFVKNIEEYSSTVVKVKKKNAYIQLIRNSGIDKTEAYRLTVEKDRIRVEAGSANGCFYGLQSLFQLIYSACPGGQVSCAVIQDEPRFEWRGFMLDESRHFFGMDEVKKLLDMMALHKLNKFHWHLTDMPGWRIEIKQYPLLTEVGGIGNHLDKTASARFYTQAEISEIIDYAAKRFIEVIPEIDMPGHARAAVKAYPEFSGGGSARYPEFTFNPGKEGTYGFLTNILREVAGLFPSQFIHIGGDEVHFGNQEWNNLPDVQQLMRTEDLKDLVEVEHYFLRRMSDSVQKLDKTLIGWDEVVGAELPVANTVAMWWRHDKPELLAESLKKGYQVIMCPRLPLYFSFIQHESHKHLTKWTRFAPIESVYKFPDELNVDGVSVGNPLIKGIQANQWTEYIHTPEILQFKTYPRLSALAEAAWTNESMKELSGFFKRMDRILELYDKTGNVYFDFRNPDIKPNVKPPVW